MSKINLYTKGNKREINAEWFTSTTQLKEIGDTLKMSEQNMYHVTFQNGSRTKAHKHNGSQILIVTKGQGSLEIFKKTRTKKDKGIFGIKKTQKTPLKNGDVVYIPANTLHTHGSTSKKTFSHIAINILPRKNGQYKTIWYESNFKDMVYKTIK